MKRFCQTLCLLLPVLWVGIAVASGIQFPALTGRVVDDAHMLSSGTIARLTQELQSHEEQTTDQVVVVTLPSLQGQTIEDFGYQLGRHWGIGQKGKDNGALLIVAPEERKVRIEVGYGLEGTLTDAQSSQIVHGIILPSFRAGHMEEGVINGTESILAVLGGKPVPYTQPGRQSPPGDPLSTIIYIFIFVVYFMSRFIAIIIEAVTGKPANKYKSGWFLGTFGTGGTLNLSGGSGGGFSGGGGGFGGGGCSGGW